MSKQISKPLALAIGAALVGGVAFSASAFAMTDLASGYMVSGAEAKTGTDKKAEGSCGSKMAAEASCGADKKTAEGKCGEGKCGMDKMDSDKDGRISSAEFAAVHDGDASKFGMHDTNKDGFISAEELKAHMEGKCGEGKCGGDKAKAGDTKVKMEGDTKAKMEGKCGEGKCGGSV
jgi:uncharacterized low-complexity protein